ICTLEGGSEDDTRSITEIEVQAEAPASALIRNLISTSQGCLSGSEPGKLPGETNSGTKIVAVWLIERDVRIWPVRADQLKLCQAATNSRSEPILKRAA